MPIVLILSVILLAVSVVLAVMKREQSPIYYAVMSGVVLYVLSGVL